MATEHREKLFHLLATKALAFGDFTLASGKKSDHFFNCKTVTRTPEGMYLIGNLLFDLIQEQCPEADGIGGLTMGADPICDAVTFVSYERQHPIESLIVRKETKDHGTKRQIEGNVTAVTNLVVIDDVVTTAGSTIKAIESFQTEPALNIVSVMALVDRAEGGREALKEMDFDLYALYSKQELMDYAKSL
jgi:orotate phosphoribosyltransferase